ncbi:MAG: transposase, partial [Deltaproteobacteria bacterium]|nr:transposase [Deltaproteobacteria bacterium]
MGRPLRIEYPDAFYHITARGNEQQDIFRNNKDRERFLGYLESASERYKAIIHTYCLMDNHYHILLQTPAGNLSQIMHHINGAYTNYFNTKRKRAGHLFQGRYKALLVDIDEYAQELSRYIHLNPAKAGMVEKPEEYKWSSYQDYIGFNKSPDWLFTDFVLSLFDRELSVARKQYRKFVESMVNIEYESPLKNVFASTILGGSNFINEIREKYLDTKKPDRDLPDLKHFHEIPDVEDIMKQTAKAFDEDAALLKRVQIYLFHKFSGQKLKDIGVHFGIGVSGVSQTSRRVAMQIRNDKRLKKKVDKLILDLGLST